MGWELFFQRPGPLKNYGTYTNWHPITRSGHNFILPETQTAPNCNSLGIFWGLCQASYHMLSPKWVSHASMGQGPAFTSDANRVVGNFYWAFEGVAWDSVERLSAGTRCVGGRDGKLWASTTGALGEQEEPQQSTAGISENPLLHTENLRTFAREGQNQLRCARAHVFLLCQIYIVTVNSGRYSWVLPVCLASWWSLTSKILLAPCDHPVRRPFVIHAHRGEAHSWAFTLNMAWPGTDSRVERLAPQWRQCHGKL